MTLLKSLIKTSMIAALLLSSASFANPDTPHKTSENLQSQTNHYAAFNVTVIGKGRPILLIPGVSSSASVWDSTVDALKNDYQLHVFNLAGFAGVPAAPFEKVGASLLTFQKQAIKDYISLNKLSDVVVIGHSLGGFISLSLATDDNDHIAAIVNVDGLPALGALFANLPKPDQQPAFDPKAMVKSMANNNEWHSRILADMKRSDPMTSGRAMGELMQSDIRGLLQNIKIPTLTLAAPAQGLPYASIEQSKQNYVTQLENIPAQNNKLAFAETARHFIMADEPEWMNTQIKVFLGNL